MVYPRKGWVARTGAVLCVLLWVLPGAGGSALAAAKNKKKPVSAKPPSMADMAPSVPAPSVPAPSVPAVEPRPGVARFFTINQVLAKHDGRPAGEAVRLAALDPAPSVTDVPAVPAAPAGTIESDQPFGLYTFRAPEGLLWVKWRKVQAEIEAETALLARCAQDACDSAALRRFQAVVAAARTHSGRARLEAVNRAINSAIRYTGDLAQHGVLDRWTAPLATLASGQGDCEDYAIAKYVALKTAGMDEGDLRILLVKDRAVRQDHAVLAARLDGHWLVLDNRHLALTPDRELAHFTPLFTLDAHGVNLFAAPYADRGEPADRAEPAPAAEGDGDPGWTGSIRRGGADKRRPSRELLMM